MQRALKPFPTAKKNLLLFPHVLCLPLTNCKMLCRTIYIVKVIKGLWRAQLASFRTASCFVVGGIYHPVEHVLRNSGDLNLVCGCWQVQRVVEHHTIDGSVQREWSNTTKRYVRTRASL